METGDWIQLAGIVFIGIGLIISIRSNRNQIKIFNKQAQLNFFREYTKRYHDIIVSFPINIGKGDTDIRKLDHDVKNKTLKYMRAYFDLCSEEYHLHEEKLIDDKVWKNWKKGIEASLSKKVFKDAWLEIEKHASFDENFRKWANEITKG